MTTTPTITQADRDAAAEQISVWGDIRSCQEAYDVRHGKHDDHPLVQAFAAHRINALAALTNPSDAMVEAVAMPMMNALHANVPEAERPQGWCDFSDEQIERVKAGATAALSAAAAFIKEQP